MKKFLSASLLLSLLLVNAELWGQAHEQGDINLSPGASFGNYNRYGPDFGVSFVFYADFSPHDYASVGPYFNTLFSTGTAFGFGARGNFHMWQLIDDNVDAELKADIIDVYLSLYVGGEFSNYYNHRARVGGMAGVRWYFVERIAFMFELGGPPGGFTTFGVSFKL